ncbi:J domain-containing protein [Synechococcus elongatus IITB4]|uniref:J domain-containing protein n=1 Tax=Synechococcus elongatus TaxID=32046 RepID=UPI0030D4C270
MAENYYELLGVPANASFEVIKAAYYRICKDLHPDNLPVDAGPRLRQLAEEQLKLITVAYSTLKDPELRRNYDRGFDQTVMPDPSPEPEPQPPAKLRLEDLLADHVLLEGFEQLCAEEQELYDRAVEAILQTRSGFLGYLPPAEASFVNFYPDSVSNRIHRVLRIFYSFIPGTLIGFGLFVGFIWFCLLVIEFGLGLLLGSAPIAWAMFISNSFWAITIILMLLFSALVLLPDVSTDDTRTKREKISSYYLFSGCLRGYYQRFLDLGSQVRVANFRQPLYPSAYVKSIRAIAKDFEANFQKLHRDRQQKIDRYQQLNRLKLTIDFVAQLSLPDRFLLYFALDEKAKAEKSEKARQDALKVAGAVGLVALFIASGGGIGPWQGVITFPATQEKPQILCVVLHQRLKLTI